MNWRETGDCTYDEWVALIPIMSRIRQDGEVFACYSAAAGLRRLCLGMLKAESSFATNFAANTPANKNALNLRPRGGGSGFMAFPSWAVGIAEWKARLTDPIYAYAPTTTVADLVHVYAPSSDHNNEAAYVATVEGVITALTPKEAPMPDPTAQLNMTQDLIPLPNLQMDIITDAENSAWDSLGKKEVWAFVLHRQLGSNESTRLWFRRGAASTGLTEFGQRASGGQIYVWNSPLGFASPGTSPDRAPWASGVFNVHGDAYGDGLKFEQAHGLNAINGKAAAWEIDGKYNDPWSDAAQQEAAQACAHYAHNYGIPWHLFPMVPGENRSFVIWHQEITGPAEKICPGPVVMAATPAWIERVRVIMKAAQTASVVEQPAPPPKQPKYAKPVKITKASAYCIPYSGRLKVIKAYTPMNVASAKGQPTGAEVPVGKVVQPKWFLIAEDATGWFVTSGGSRHPAWAFFPTPGPQK